jgi:hypothetical protein
VLFGGVKASRFNGFTARGKPLKRLEFFARRLTPG